MQRSGIKYIFVGCAVLGWLAVTPVRAADITLPVLKVGSEVYSNVTITSFNATDLYFSYKGGMGNAKLKNLSPELQHRFSYDPVKAAAAEQKKFESNAQFRQGLTNQKPASVAMDVPEDDDKDVVAPQVHARSYRGHRAPQIIVETWVTPPPNVDGKFVLIEFWRTSAAPCRQIIPHLNELHAKFHERMVLMSLTDDSPEEVLKVEQAMKYYVGVDPKGRTMATMEITEIPHSLLIDPKGIVRYEGTPGYLNANNLQRLLDKYSQ